jgi:hypothetical protein
MFGRSRELVAEENLQRIRRKPPKMDFLKKKHEDCDNFDKGNCKFFHFTNVDSKGAACPYFKAEKITDSETAKT